MPVLLALFSLKRFVLNASDPDQVEAQAKAPFGDPTAEQVEETREHMIRVVARVIADELVEHKKSLVQ